ncbi:hypothetical protein [Paenibacillus sp. MMS18-CY102]|uniref:hypothetical protein n=1 Tax=Paenibacillus sp. MMS18-CY102 TaxID=2682849 RepID=UPI001365B3A8|nr:hypothetical protein [Paenibacillus sp. MMS18-CY102]MWC28716.1 hypothetical protein [Paenibacillus sp. MMS18-CY102]
MQEEEFRRFLENDPSITSEKAVNSRMSRARRIEQEFKINIDYTVRDDDRMYAALLNVKDKDSAGNFQNVIRKYYIFINSKKFPTLSTYSNKLKKVR